MKKIFKSFALVSAAATFTRLISFVFKIYLSRTLGAEMLGVYQIASSVIATLACVSSSGIPVTLSRLVAENVALGKSSKGSSFLSAATVLSLSFAVIACAVFAAFPSLAEAMFSDSRCVPIFYIMLPLLATSALYSCLRGWFWGNKNYGVYATTELTDEITKILFSVLLFSGTLAFINADQAYAYAIVASDVLVVIMLITLYFVCGGKAARPYGFKEIAGSSAPLTATRLSGSAVSTLISLSLPVLLCKSFSLTTSQATAELGRATGMVIPLLFAPTAVTGSLAVVVIPEFASLNAVNGKDKIGSALSRAIKYSCLVTGFFFALFAASGVALGRLLYDDEQAGRYISFAAVAMLPMGANGLCVSTLNSLGKETSTFVSHAVGLGVLIVVLFTCVRFAGIYAYFVALTISHACSLAINAAKLAKLVKPDKKPLSQAAAAYAFCAVSVFALHPLCNLLSDLVSDLAAVSAIVVVFAVLYALYAFLSGSVSSYDLNFLSPGNRKKT